MSTSLHAPRLQVYADRRESITRATRERHLKNTRTIGSPYSRIDLLAILKRRDNVIGADIL